MYPNHIHINADGSAQVTYFGFFREREVTLPMDGKITDDVIGVFTSGHCHSFALAMHRLTGWQMVGVCLFGESVERQVGYEDPSHIMVRHPSGQYVDIHGFYEPRKSYPELNKVVPVTEAQIMDFRSFFQPDPTIAITYVQTVLKQIGRYMLRSNL